MVSANEGTTKDRTRLSADNRQKAFFMVISPIGYFRTRFSKTHLLLQAGEVQGVGCCDALRTQKVVNRKPAPG
jgi:hypothetical protein